MKLIVNRLDDVWIVDKRARSENGSALQSENGDYGA